MIIPFFLVLNSLLVSPLVSNYLQTNELKEIKFPYFILYTIGPLLVETKILWRALYSIRTLHLSLGKSPLINTIDNRLPQHCNSSKQIFQTNSRMYPDPASFLCVSLQTHSNLTQNINNICLQNYMFIHIVFLVL